MRTPRLSPNRAQPVARLLLFSLLSASLGAASAQTKAADIIPLPGSSNPRVFSGHDLGPIAPETSLRGIALHFRRTPTQEADLQQLLAAQQDPNSPQFHQWLTPEQFAARFGLPDSAIAQMQIWLEQHGFTIDSIARGKTMLRFSGAAAQIDAAFATELHTYAIPTASGLETHFAPAIHPTIPAELAPFVQAIANLDDFRPKPNLHLRPKPHFSGYDQSIFFTPADIALQYDIQPAYAAGFDGAGQSIAVVGQSQISPADIESFQTASSLPVKDPNLVLVPNTGVAIFSPGDESESDLDLEWSGAIAPGATITLVYTGVASNLGAFDAAEYAIDNRIANLVGISYSACETALDGLSLETFFAQAAAQGQTVVAASGDEGSTSCFFDTDLTVQQQQALAVDYPASSPNVTAVGGTEISQANSAYETQGGAYWEKSNGSSDIVASLIQPVPEQAWNEDQTCSSFANQGANPICSGGGGASALFARPAWQTGVPGIPFGNQRLLPDVALNAAIFNPGYLFCTSDQSFWQNNQVGSCSGGFRDVITGDLTAAGGTSFAAPIFAAMMAIVNQRQGYVTGSGPANPTLYILASNSATYASAFRDIATGGNQCDAGSFYCNGAIGFAATSGYDQATGLGAIDLFHLAAAWPASTGPALIATTTTVSASSKTPALNAADIFTIAVASVTGTTTPTGSISIAVDANPPLAGNPLTASDFTYSTAFASAGTHEVLVTYSGDATHAPSTGSAAIQIPTAISGPQNFSLAATNGTVNSGSSGTSLITVTPANGYIGTVNLTLSTGNNTALQNLCFLFTNGTNGSGTVTIAGARSVKTQLKFIDMASDCITSPDQRQTAARSQPSNRSQNSNPATPAAALAALLLAGFLARKGRRLRALTAMLLLASASLAATTLVTGCGGSNHSPTVSSPPIGTVTVTGQDSADTTIPTATTTFQLTID
jgi:hypothetical protein